MRWVAAPLVLAAALGCGKRGDPLPPLARTPQPVKDFSIGQRGPELEIRYTAPRTTTGGARLDLHTVEILTARGEGDFAKTALVEVRKVAPGETVAVSQPLPPPGTRLRVAARAVSGGDRSTLTAVATLLVQPPPSAPTDLKARSRRRRWSWPGRDGPSPPPAPSPSPAPSPGSRFVSRVAGQAGDPVAALDAAAPAPSRCRNRRPRLPRVPARSLASYEAPMNPVPITVNAFEDRTAVAGPRCATRCGPPLPWTRGGERALQRSLRGLKDVAPPPLRPGCHAGRRRCGGGFVEPVRGAGPGRLPRVPRPRGGAPARLAEIPAGQTTWRDEKPGRGGLHLYTVTAFDQSGNESAPSKPAEGHLP